MQRTIRTFVAIEASPAVRSRALDLIRRLSAAQANVRWVETAGLHLTLKFLGDVEATAVNDVCRAVESAVAGQHSFTAELLGAAAFPDVRRPRTIWIGVEQGREQLRELHDRIDAALMSLGYPGEGRQFTPHLTIGRVKQGARGLGKLSALLEKVETFAAGAVDVDEVCVFSRRLERAGPVHEVLFTAPLAPA